MRFLKLFILLTWLGFMVTACAKPPQSDASSLAAYNKHLTDEEPLKTFLKPSSAERGLAKIKPGRLRGRTLYVSSISDIKLKPGEVVLTFDDGPHPTRTPRILATLDKYGVKATFLMVGQMASAHASTARKVARAGHSIGTHTYAHSNLAQLGQTTAYGRITKGARAVSKAVAPSGKKIAPFFRFPYLAHTSSLRRKLADHSLVVLDVDVDSLDYRPHAPGEMNRRTMARLKRKGKGVILFHDIQSRTAANLDAFLQELKANGFKVVHLAHRGANDFNAEVASSK